MDMDDYWIEESLQEIFQSERVTWKTKDGRVLSIAEMDTDHIRNTIKFLNKQGSIVPAKMYEILKIREQIEFMIRE